MPVSRVGSGFQSLGYFLLAGGPKDRPADRPGDGVRVGARVQFGDHTVNDRERIPSVGVVALHAAGPADPVPGRDAAGVSAGGVRLWLRPADRAVPVLATALEAPQLLAALGATRWRDRRGTGLAEGNQQVTDAPGRGRAAVGQYAGMLGQVRGGATSRGRLRR